MTVKHKSSKKRKVPDLTTKHFNEIMSKKFKTNFDVAEYIAENKKRIEKYKLEIKDGELYFAKGNSNRNVTKEEDERLKSIF